MVIDQTWHKKKKEVGGEKERRGQEKERREARLRSPSPALSRASLLEITGPSARMKGAGRREGALSHTRGLLLRDRVHLLSGGVPPAIHSG